MVTDFRCQQCGMMVHAASDVCPYCHRPLEIPPLMHQMPRPHFPGEMTPVAVASVDLSPAADARFEALGRAMPWALSLLLHVGVALVLMFIWMVAQNRLPITITLTDPILPSDPGDKPTMVPSKNPDVKTNTNNSRKERSINLPRRDEQIQTPGRPEGRPGETLKRGADGLIGISMTPNTPGDGGLDLHGPPGIFRPSGDGDGPRGKFVGSVVYVIDRSGSMVDSFDLLRLELVSSISRLESPSKFHVIFFCDNQPQENRSRCLTDPSKEAKAELADFIKDVRPSGQTDPIPALERALEVLNDPQAPAPKVIHLLTDGEFPNNAKVLNLVRSKAAPRGVRIQTYLYGSQSGPAEQVLRAVAQETGGNYRFILSQ